MKMKGLECAYQAWDDAMDRTKTCSNIATHRVILPDGFNCEMCDEHFDEYVKNPREEMTFEIFHVHDRACWRRCEVIKK